MLLSCTPTKKKVKNQSFHGRNYDEMESPLTNHETQKKITQEVNERALCVINMINSMHMDRLSW